MARTSFVVDPMQFFVGPRRADAIRLVENYFTEFTGAWFERLTAVDEPDRITERDLLAVCTLGVTVPAPTVIWLLGDGAAPATELLRRIPATQRLWDDDADSSPDGPAGQLWELVRSNGWPEPRGGMGRTTTSKLLAAKRPHLVPIQDSIVTELLFGGARYESYWMAWHQRLTAADGPELVAAVESVRAEVPAAAHLSVLRVLDVVLWRAGRND